MRRAAFFDMDKTLLSVDTAMSWTKFLYRRGELPKAMLAKVPAKEKNNAEVAAIQASIELAAQAKAAGPVDDLKAKADPSFAVGLTVYTGAEYLVCSRVYPTPELADEAIDRGRRRIDSGGGRWGSWEQALSSVSNRELVAFFQGELAAAREAYLLRRMLLYRVQGKRRWFMAARNRNAYLWQKGRFAGDVEFWQSRLSDSTVVKPVKRGLCLRLFLESAGDFQSFSEAFSGPLQQVDWYEVAGSEEQPLEDTELDS